MMGIFFAEDNLVGWDAPIDAECGVVPGKGAFGLWGIEVVALVLEDDFIAKHTESVGKASGYEELAMVLFGKFATDLLSVSG